MHDGETEQTKRSTTALYSDLIRSDNLERFLQEHADALDVPQFHAYITELCKRRGEVPERVISRANIENSFGHQIFSGRRNPSRDTVLQLAFGFEADADAAQTLLKIAGRSQLYPRVKRDAAILYCLQHHVTIVEAQGILHGLDLPLIGGNGK